MLWARICGACFLMTGLVHFVPTGIDAMVPMIPDFLPYPVFWILGRILDSILGSISDSILGRALGRFGRTFSQTTGMW